MKITTFRDFTWCSHHHIASKHGAAAHPHWHTYTARFWFKAEPDQDALAGQLEKVFGKLHGAALNAHVNPISTDEAVAAWLLNQAQQIGDCIRVCVTNDGQRGAEIEK
jgi:hypothetical protein